MATRSLRYQSTTAWCPDRLLQLLLIWTSLTTLPFWLVFVRGAMDGSTYQWGLFGTGGSGVSGDYWLPVLGVAVAVTIRILGWRGARVPFHWLLVMWLLLLTGAVTYGAAAYGEQFTFQGDTLGVSFRLGPAGIILSGGFAMLAVYWVYRDVRGGKRRAALPWRVANRRWTLGLVALVPLQLLLLRFGTPDGTADQIGVLLTIGQWFLLGRALKPRLESATVRAP